MKTKNLLSPINLGDLKLKNRVFMAPTTRTRVTGDSVISPMASTYYAQRASAGLIISEVINIARGGEVGALMPGIYTDEQINAWKNVTEAVHAKDGVIFAQVGHSGRVSLPDFNDGQTPIAPSAVEFVGAVYRIDGAMVQPPVPRALELNEIHGIIQLYKQAAVHAKTAGFDGIELHACNAGLAEQFLHPESNIRTDEYGGSLENRARFILEVIDTLITVFGNDRVGIRLSPHDRLSQQLDPNPLETSVYLANELSKKGIGYLHILEPVVKNDPFLPFPEENPVTIHAIRENYKGLIIVNGGYSKETSNDAIAGGVADAVSFGRAFIANPDLPYRLKYDLELNAADGATFYGLGEEGYIDYPFISELLTAEAE
jgi:N-ethylmaleimide reductase